jgi:hypothetical protein
MNFKLSALLCRRTFILSFCWQLFNSGIPGNDLLRLLTLKCFSMCYEMTRDYVLVTLTCAEASFLTSDTV